MKKEQKLACMTLGELAEAATAMVAKTIADKGIPTTDTMYAHRVNEYIRNTVRDLLPVRTLYKRGVRVEVRTEGTAAYKNVAQSVSLVVRLRKNHPFYDKGSDAAKYNCSTITLLTVKRSRLYGSSGPYVFQSLQCAENSKKARAATVLELCETTAGFMGYQASRVWDAMRTMLEFTEILGEEQMRRLLKASAEISKINDYFFDAKIGRYRIRDWAQKEDLMEFSGMNARNRRIFDAIAAGTREAPIGVNLEKLGVLERVAPDDPDRLKISSIRAAEDGGWIVSGQIGERRYYRLSEKQAVSLYLEDAAAGCRREKHTAEPGVTNVKVIISDGCTEDVLADNCGNVSVEILDIDKDYEDYTQLLEYKEKLYSDKTLKPCDFTIARFDEE